MLEMPSCVYPDDAGDGSVVSRNYQGHPSKLIPDWPECRGPQDAALTHEWPTADAVSACAGSSATKRWVCTPESTT